MNRVIRIKLPRPDYSPSVRKHFSLINPVDLMEIAWSDPNEMYSGVHVMRCCVEKGNMSHTGRVSPTLFPSVNSLLWLYFRANPFLLCSM